MAPGGFGPPRRPVSTSSPARTGPTGNDGPRRPARSARRMRTMSSPGQGSRAPAGADVGATLREMWATRPARLKEDRKIAGVAAAIARRYAVDPTLVRVGFVVSLFYGVGLLVYLAGILVLPRVDETGRRRETPVWAIVIGTLLGIAAVASAFSGDLGTVIGIVVAVALLYALHRSRGHLRDPQRPVAVDGVTPTVRARRGPEAAVVGSARRGTVRLGPPGARGGTRAAEAPLEGRARDPRRRDRRGRDRRPAGPARPGAARRHRGARHRPRRDRRGPGRRRLPAPGTRTDHRGRAAGARAGGRRQRRRERAVERRRLPLRRPTAPRAPSRPSATPPGRR